MNICVCSENKIICRDKNPQLYDIPINSKFLYLDFRYCKMGFIVEGYLERYLDLKELDIREQKVNFNCRSLPLKRNFRILTDCPEPSTFSPIRKSTTTLKTEFSSSISSTSKKTTEKIKTSTLKSLTSTKKFSEPELSTSTKPMPTKTNTERTWKTTKTSHFYTSSTYKTSEIKTSFQTTNQVYSSSPERKPSSVSSRNGNPTDFISETNIFDTFSDINTSTPAFIKASPDKIAWIVLSCVITGIILMFSLFILTICILKRKKIRQQLENNRRNNRIFFGSGIDFETFHRQMLADDPEENTIDLQEMEDSDL